MRLQSIPFNFWKSLICVDCGHPGTWRTRAWGYGYVLGEPLCDWCEEQRKLELQADNQMQPADPDQAAVPENEGLRPAI